MTRSRASSPVDSLPRRAWLARAGRWLAAGAGGPALAQLGGCAQPTLPPMLGMTAFEMQRDSAAPVEVARPALLEDLARRTFRYFWETADPRTGLAPDRWPTPAPCSVAAVGFALTAYIVGIERGYVSRDDARERTLTTLRTLVDLPQGPAPTGMSGYKGFYYHFLEMDDGRRAGTCELSTVDTALLLCGALHAQAYFDHDDTEDTTIRNLVQTMVDRIDWRWAQPRPPSIALGWAPEKGFLPYDWRGYNEASVLYLLALGDRDKPVDVSAWQAWTENFRRNWSTFNGEQALHFPPLFGHQYSSCWVDFRRIRDAFMRSHGIDYFENSRRVTIAQRAYAILNPKRWAGYEADIWGLTACDGPGDVTARFNGEMRTFRSYSARGVGGDGPDSFDDGTIAPTAAASSIAFAPDIATKAVQTMIQRYGAWLYTDYGFLDAFNPSFRYEMPLRHGRVVPGVGWFAEDHLGIDQGPILAMIANYTDGTVWRHMRRCDQVRRGLQRAGFTGGWLDGRA